MRTSQRSTQAPKPRRPSPVEDGAVGQRALEGLQPHQARPGGRAHSQLAKALQGRGQRCKARVNCTAKMHVAPAAWRAAGWPRRCRGGGGVSESGAARWLATVGRRWLPAVCIASGWPARCWHISPGPQRATQACLLCTPIHPTPGLPRPAPPRPASAAAAPPAAAPAAHVGQRARGMRLARAGGRAPLCGNAHSAPPGVVTDPTIASLDCSPSSEMAVDTKL